MRELKFRAWDKSGKRFWLFELKPQDVVDEYLGDDIQQYTGLKDKNGKEIYEGDIVSNGDYIPDAHCCNDLGNAEVRWCEESGMWVGMIGEVIEVIGNIYENPELL